MARIPPGQIVQALVARGVPEHTAQGVVMNFMDESGLETGIEERVANSHGTKGYGLAQWTDSRRVALDNFARAQGKPINDLDVQLDFFMHENAGPEAAAWKQVLAAPTANEAAANFVHHWERPASKYDAQRQAKYMGADAAKVTSPYGLQARHPGQTTVGTGGYVAPGADTTQVPQAAPAVAQTEDKRDPYQTAAAGVLESAAPAAKAPQMPRAPQMQAQMPMAMEATPLLAQNNMSRDQLAMLMQRLNSNTLTG